MRRLGLVATTALAATVTAACAPLPVACPAVGYFSTLSVTLAEPRDDVALELCLSAGCAPAPLDELASDEAIADGLFGEASGDGLEGWTISIMSGGTDAVGYRLLDVAGTVLAEGEVEPEWVRVGGSEQCGGPTEAEIVLG
ncbi:hypothetical protein SAMN04489720_1457 [Agrococcus jejuensis]|uniref:Lipoprotein n=2 Tax=Agrococcus jejuensis TaxID=399736 RepID=A0A1G8CZH8_9MICO|nr:hypothetical protein SAMN04489720_1457 [Agrococcus jejuensis]